MIPTRSGFASRASLTLKSSCEIIPEFRTHRMFVPFERISSIHSEEPSCVSGYTTQGFS